MCSAKTLSSCNVQQKSKRGWIASGVPLSLKRLLALSIPSLAISAGRLTPGGQDSKSAVWTTSHGHASHAFIAAGVPAGLGQSIGLSSCGGTCRTWSVDRSLQSCLVSRSATASSPLELPEASPLGFQQHHRGAELHHWSSRLHNWRTSARWPIQSEAHLPNRFEFEFV